MGVLRNIVTKGLGAPAQMQVFYQGADLDYLKKKHDFSYPSIQFKSELRISRVGEWSHLQYASQMWTMAGDLSPTSGGRATKNCNSDTFTR